MKRLLVLLVLVSACGDDDDDAPPLPECGIDAPGQSRCLDERTLERCKAAGEKETIDCGEALCGPSTTVAGGAACVATGSECGVVDTLGACLGEVLAWCYNDEVLVIADCGGQASVCAEVSATVGFNCTTACLMGGVTAEGSCNGNAVEKCELRDGEYHIVQQPCPAEMECVDVLTDTGGAGCQPLGDCAVVGQHGGCIGDLLRTCVDGQPGLVDCTVEGNICTFGDDGHVCAAPGSVGARRVAGVVRYEDRAPMSGGGLGPTNPLPARRVSISVVDDASGAVLAAGFTADDGSYSLAYDAADGSQQHVLAATTSGTVTRALRVVRADGLTHGLASASFTAAGMAGADLLASHASGLAGAFNIYDMGVHAYDVITGLGFTPEALFIVWARGADNGTYYIFQRNGIYLLGGPADDDGHDDPVILHEIGHYFEDTVGRSDSPGGPHNGEPIDPTLAWSEGFATYFALSTQGSPIYVDSNASGGWSQDSDVGVTVTPEAGGNMMQNVAEGMVSEILWDLGDGGAGDDDSFAGNHAAVLRVQPDYLGSDALFADRGVFGVDLVDWLDGWFLAGGLASCEAARDVVTDLRKFPYDFAGQGGACPE